MPKEQVRKNRREWLFLGIQLVPLLVMMLTVVACSGGGDIGGLGYTIGTDIFLNGFRENANDNFFDPASQPVLTNENLAQQAGTPCVAIFFPEVIAQLTIRNGIGAVIEQISVEFTETNGQALVDLSTPVPVSRAGEFDFIINSNISIPANQITSIPTTNGEPFGQSTSFFIPIQLYQTNIYCNFIVNQPRARPLLAKITFRGVDVMENRFTLVGYQLMSPLITVQNSGS